MKISIIIPVFNEVNTIGKIIHRIKRLKDLDLQIIVIDDCSNDGTTDLLKNNLAKSVDRILFHKKNLGKGAAIKSGKKFINGDIVIIQDADLEYDPKDYYKLIRPIVENKFKVVYGSRVLGKKRYFESLGFLSNFRIFCNHILTIFSNIINNQHLTDAHTCYKVFKSDIFKKIIINENDFAFCPEINSKISRLGLKIKEVPIKYHGRTVKEGKKIKFYDGLRAIFVLIKYRLIF